MFSNCLAAIAFKGLRVSHVSACTCFFFQSISYTANPIYYERAKHIEINCDILTEKIQEAECEDYKYIFTTPSGRYTYQDH